MKYFTLILSLSCFFVINTSAQEFYTSIGADFPEFEIEDIEGNLVTNKTLKGKPSLLVFFGTRCPPCLKELKALNNNLQASHYKDFNIYAVGSTDDTANLILFNNKKNYSFSYLPDPNQDLFDQIGDHTIPRTFLLDSNAKIISQTVGFYKTPFQNLLRKMERLMD